MGCRVSKKHLIATLQKTGGLISLAARELGISRQAIHKRIADDDSLREELNEIREVDLDIAEAKLKQSIRKGDAWAVRFYLQTLGRERGYVTRSETTGADGGPVRVDLSSVSDADLAKLTAAVEKGTQ